MDEVYGAMARNGGFFANWIDENRFRARLWPADFLHVYAFEIAKDSSKLRHVMNLLAIKSKDTQKVMSHFNLRNVEKSHWTPNLTGDFSEKVFITEPLNNWVFVMGPGLADHYLNDDTESKNLSKIFGEVCYFFYDNDSMIFKWSRALNGKIKRSYCDKSRDETAKQKHKAYLIRAFFFNEKCEDNSDLVRTAGSPTDTERRFKQCGKDTLGDPLNVQEMMKLWVFQEKDFPSNPLGYLGKIYFPK